MARKPRVIDYDANKAEEVLKKACQFFAANVDDFIHVQKVPISALARAVKVSPNNTIQGWFKFGSLPIGSTIILLCCAMHKTPNELFGITEEDVR